MRSQFVLSFCLFVIGCGVELNRSSTKHSGAFIDGIANGEYRVFLTNAGYTGNLGGVAGADALCATSAANAGLERKYFAYISVSGNAARNRIVAEGPIYIYVSPTDRRRVGTSLSTIWATGGLEFPMRYTEFYQVMNVNVATGSTSAGASTGADCSSWTATGGAVSVGSSNATGSAYTGGTVAFCNSTSIHLYCINQP